MILIDEYKKEHRHSFGDNVTSRSAIEIKIKLGDLGRFPPDKTIEYIQCVLASRLTPDGKITITL